MEVLCWLRIESGSPVLVHFVCN